MDMDLNFYLIIKKANLKKKLQNYINNIKVNNKIKKIKIMKQVYNK